MKQYNRIIKNYLKSIFNRRTLPFVLCIAGILVVFILVSSMGGSNADSIDPADTAFAEKSRILVGVVPDDGTFCAVDENGKATGYECELVQTLLAEYYPDVPVEFITIDSQMASYELKHGNIDIAIGMFVKDITKTQGLSLTVSYYTDGLYAYAKSGSEYTTLASLQGHTVYLMTTEYPASLVTKAFSEMGIELKTVSCSSYPDAVTALENGTAAAIVGMPSRMNAKDYELTRIDEEITHVAYRALFWTDHSDITTLFNRKLNAMLENGSLDELREKYGLETSKK